MTATSGKSLISWRRTSISERSSTIQTWRTLRYPSSYSICRAVFIRHQTDFFFKRTETGMGYLYSSYKKCSFYFPVAKCFQLFVPCPNEHDPAGLVSFLWLLLALKSLAAFVFEQQGKLAKELDFVGHHVRTKLDELKRQEVNRLRTLIKAKQDAEGGHGTLVYLLFKYVISYLNGCHPMSRNVCPVDRTWCSAPPTS